jgi:hypothetical protein
MPQNPEPTVSSLLDDIHQTLLARQYDRLSSLTLALEDALSRAKNLDSAALALIHTKAARNAATLTAVQRGIRAALRRVAEIRSVSTGLVTYDTSGLRQDLVSAAMAQRL